MIDLMKLPASEAERLAYAEGFAGVGELLARLSDAQATLNEAKRLLIELTQQVREDIPSDQATPHLWQAVEDALDFIDNMEG